MQKPCLCRTIFKKNYNFAIGFTLIELLVGMSIFCVLMSSIYVGFRGGMLVWKRDKESLDKRYVTSIAFKNIGRNIRSTIFDAKNPELEFKGTDKNLSFCFIGKDGFIWQGNYQLAHGISGNKNSLYCKTAKIWHKQVVREEAFAVLDGISSFKFGYFDDRTKSWQEEWQDKQKLPAAVKITLNIEDSLPQNSVLNFEKIIYLPLAENLDTARLKAK